MILKKIFMVSAFTVASFAVASAHSVALEENFDGEYAGSFPLDLELDCLPPFDNFRSLFMDDNGVARPWWPLKDSSASNDRFICSHSAYNVEGGGTSNDWLVSKAVYIPTEGYVLSFGAQSFVLRSDERRLSDLWVFITETQPSEENLPAEPALRIENVPEGDYPDIVEKDFTGYEINLDAYAGKTVYISFANLNTDRDILAIDNVLVQRYDDIDLSVSSSRYVEAGTFEVECAFRSVATDVIRDWRLDLLCDGEVADSFSGEILEPGQEISHTFVNEVAADATVEWTVSLTADGVPAIEERGVVTGLAFIPWHNVLLEEATGMWCGNCPIGIYALENIMEHPEMKEYVIPVSVHVTQSGSLSQDYMTNENYAYMLGLTSAPTVRIDRDTRVRQFSIADDGLPVDFDNPRQLASLVKAAHEVVSFMDVDVRGDFNIVGNDTVSVSARVTLRPAVTLDGTEYRVGFALTENNVGLDGNRYWIQENYLSGSDLVSDFGGFTDLPERISGWRWMDVARCVYDFHGTDEIVLPAVMKVGEEYTFTVEIPIPQTYMEIDRNGEPYQVSPAIVASNLTLVAFVLDGSFLAHNSASYPMTPEAGVRMTIAELAEKTSVDGITVTSPADETVEYYSLSGIRVDVPASGEIYIVRRGGVVTKEIMR